MGLFTEPGHLSTIIDKRGKDWTLEERDMVKAWLWEKPQLQRILGLAYLWLRHRGGSAIQRVHAEDTWQDFNLYFSETHKRWIYPLDGVIDSYDPAKGPRFDGYVRHCFRNFCHERGAKIAKDAPVIIPLAAGDQPPPGPRLAPAPPARAPRDGAPRGLVHECIEELPESYRRVIRMFYFEEMSVAEIAEALGASRVNVRVMLHRARQKLHVCLARRHLPLMPPECQAVVRLRYLEGMTIAAIAQDLTIAEPEVHARLLRAKEKLHEILVREGHLP